MPIEYIMVKLLDIEVLNKLREDLGEDTGGIVSLFLEELSPSLMRISEAVAIKDRDEVLRLAHGLKGLSRTFGAKELVEICSSMESSSIEESDALIAKAILLEPELAIRLQEWIHE